MRARQSLGVSRIDLKVWGFCKVFFEKVHSGELKYIEVSWFNL